jgi:hypothetical protein
MRRYRRQARSYLPRHRSLRACPHRIVGRSSGQVFSTRSRLRRCALRSHKIRLVALMWTTTLDRAES